MFQSSNVIYSVVKDLKSGEKSIHFLIKGTAKNKAFGSASCV